MRDLAIIAKIQEINPIPKYDRVELATVENYPVIVQKGLYRPGDLCVYVFYDTLLPVREEFEFLRKSSYSPRYNMFRIRNMKMCGVYSSGLILPLSSLPKGFDIKEGTDVADILGIKKYDPELIEESVEEPLKYTKQNKLYKYLCKYAWFRKFFMKKRSKQLGSYPATVAKSGEVNIEKIFNTLKEEYEDRPVFYVSEKMEGCAATYLLWGKKRIFNVFSHNTPRNPKGNGVWEQVARKYDLKKSLRSEKANYAIQGEICGPGIQSNIYGFGDLRFFVYKVTNVDTGEALEFDSLQCFCNKHNLEMVPILFEKKALPGSVADMLQEAEGVSVFGKNVPREGVVYRNRYDQSVGCKCKSRSYQLWFYGNKETL